MDHLDLPDPDAVAAAPDDAVGVADRYADHLAALHRVSTLPPGDPEERLNQWLQAGLDALGAAEGIVLLGTGDHLVVRAACGEHPAEPGTRVVDRRIADVLAREAIVASLGGPAALHPGAGLGPGSLVASPLWITGTVSGAVAFLAPAGHPPYSAWQLAVIDVVADGVARVLEHQADVRTVGRAESRSQAMVDLIPDPVVRLDAAGMVLDDLDQPGAPFDPCGAVRRRGEGPTATTLAEVREAVAATLSTGQLQTREFGTGPPGDHRRVEARFVPAGSDDVLCIVRDITERYRAEVALAEQLAFETLVAASSSRLISCAAADLDHAIEAGLGEIATFFAADEAFVHELAADATTLRLSHLWTRPGQEPTRRRGDPVDLAGFARVSARFEREGRVFVRGPRPGAPAEDLPLLDGGDLGVLWVRLGAGGHLAGVVGLSWRTHAPPENEDVLGLIRFAADSFHSALRRRAITSVVAGQAEVFELIARGAPVATALLAARDLLARHCLGADVEILTVDDDGLHLVTDDDDHPWAAWFAAHSLDLGNPYGQAVITAEPVRVADALHDPRFAGRAVPDDRHRAASVLPVRSSRSGRTIALLVLLGARAGDLLPTGSVRDSVQSLVAVALERAADEAQLAHQATHDPLTGVGNRAALLDRLSLVLARAQRSGRAVAVLFCDLDGFKAVNDRHGHDRGDRLLVEVADRIRRAVRPSDTVCRTGGDEFVVVCEDLSGPEQAELIAGRVRTAIESRPVDVIDARLPVTASVGVAVADPSVHDPDQLLRMADLAMYEVKDRSRGAAAARSATTATVAVTSPLAADLAGGLARDELVLYQQPLVRRDGAIAGVEVLVRWPHPEHGLLGASRVVAAAGDAGLLPELGRWVRHQALALRRGWERPLEGRALPPVHINVTRAELHAPGFADEVESDLLAAGAGPGDLVIEIPEADLAGDDAAHVLADLAARGLTVVVDAAGEGGLSLASLAGLGLGGLKVGAGLVARLDSGALARDDVGVEVVRSLVLLAHGLGWRSFAVGVETERQRSVLFGFGVEAVQGRAVAMPVEPDAFSAWLVSRGGHHAQGERP